MSQTKTHHYLSLVGHQREALWALVRTVIGASASRSGETRPWLQCTVVGSRRDGGGSGWPIPV
ncbi:MAG: hypothetical protein DLM62_04835 [Pseudonocardiales bacterium]|nr:MAG: hypothetical protein DLM62_04835 [Pseudonocardiales bacterium]